MDEELPRIITPPAAEADLPAPVGEATPDTPPVLARRRRWPRYLAVILVAAAAALLIRLFILQASWVPSGSMRPTLVEGDYLLVNRLAYLVREPARGDVIVFRHDNLDLVKRLAAGPGDTFRFSDGYLWVNGERVDESAYLDDNAWGHTRGGSFGDETHLVPAGYYLALGDNRSGSSDSRSWGYVRRDEILGRAFMIYFSLDLPQMAADDADWREGPSYIRWNRILDPIR